MPADTPVEIRKLLRRCLQKDADRRLHDIADARIELEEIAAGGFELTAQEMRRAPPSMLRRIGWPIVVLFAVVSAIALIRDALQPESLPRAVEMMDLTLPGMQFGFSKPVEVSPDGRSIAFFRDGRLWVRDVDRLEPRELTDTAAALMPFWSPDSKWLGFVAEGRMWKIPATGGDRVVIAKLPTGVYTGAAGGVSWSGKRNHRVLDGLERAAVRTRTGRWGDGDAAFRTRDRAGLPPAELASERAWHRVRRAPRGEILG